MKNARTFPKWIIFLGVVFAIMGLATAGAGMYVRSFIGQQLADQNITTTDDATIPNAPVDGIATALSMADIIQEHADARTNGLSYAEMGRFAVESGDPAGTSNPEMALLDANGNPVPNGARNTQLTASGLVTSLSLSAMAIGISYAAIALGIGFAFLGVIISGLGYALLGLITPEVAERYGFKPVVN